MVLALQDMLHGGIKWCDADSWQQASQACMIAALRPLANPEAPVWAKEGRKPVMCAAL